MPGQHRLDAAGEWTRDELLVDERFVALFVTDTPLEQTRSEIPVPP
jgi:hypothetical protein